MASTGLKITRGDTLELPLSAATEVISFLATRGAGKSFAGADIAEELYDALIQFVIVDPMGVYWGLRSSRDGSKGGLKVTILGGDQGDVPLEPTSGRLIADVVVDTGQSFILDLSLFDSKADQVRFMEAFCERIFYRKGPIEKRTPLTVIIDEADEFAPQKPEKNETKMLSHLIRLAKRGRTRGIGLVPLTQRSAEIHKGILDLSSIVVFMRTAGPRDRKAIKDWLAGSAPELIDLVDARFPKLDTGEALIYSPHLLRLDEPIEVKFRMIRTFDSYKTPEPGQARPAPAKTAAIDLAALGEQIAATVERAKENDPAELRKRLREMEAKLRDAEANGHRRIGNSEDLPHWDTYFREEGWLNPDDGDFIERVRDLVPLERVEVPALSDKQIERLELVAARVFDEAAALGKVSAEMRAEVIEMLTKVPTAEPVPISSLPAAPPRLNATTQRETRPAPPPPRPGPEAAANGASGGENLPPMHRRILDAIAWWASVGQPEPPIARLAFLVGYHTRSKSFTNALGSLSTGGYIVRERGIVALTDAGRMVAQEPTSILDDHELQERIYDKLPPLNARILRRIIEHGPDLNIETLAEEFEDGFKKISDELYVSVHPADQFDWAKVVDALPGKPVHLGTDGPVIGEIAGAHLEPDGRLLCTYRVKIPEGVEVFGGSLEHISVESDDERINRAAFMPKRIGYL